MNIFTTVVTLRVRITIIIKVRDIVRVRVRVRARGGHSPTEAAGMPPQTGGSNLVKSMGESYF